MKESLTLSSKILLSSQRKIITFARIEVPEDKISLGTDDNQKKKKQNIEYKIWPHTF